MTSVSSGWASPTCLSGRLRLVHGEVVNNRVFGLLDRDKLFRYIEEFVDHEPVIFFFFNITTSDFGKLMVYNQNKHLFSFIRDINKIGCKN